MIASIDSSTSQLYLKSPPLSLHVPLPRLPPSFPFPPIWLQPVIKQSLITIFFHSASSLILLSALFAPNLFYIPLGIFPTRQCVSGGNGRGNSSPAYFSKNYYLARRAAVQAPCRPRNRKAASPRPRRRLLQTGNKTNSGKGRKKSRI